MTIDRIVVAVPARDEAGRLPRALAAIAVAIAKLADASGPAATVAVAADACTDDTAVLAAQAGVLVVETPFARVGAARASAIATGLEATADPPGRVWIANTDADSTVHPDWLIVHWTAAIRGTALLCGSIRPDPLELTARQSARWLRFNPPCEVHDFVHGANLGVRADVYLAAGGFGSLAAHEDLALVAAVQALGAQVDSTDRAPVVTSARAVGRTPEGFARYLRDEVLPPSADRSRIDSSR